MKNIRKKSEPGSWTTYRCTPGADYDGCDKIPGTKQDLRESLSSEQGAICCYCMQRIQPTWNDMKVEHWHSQKHFSSEQLDYGNLLAACLGGEGQPREQQHCDTRKGQLELSRNPANLMHNVEGIIRYLGDGKIESSDEKFNAELNEVLNLNLPLLMGNRKAVLDAFIQSMSRSGSWPSPVLRRKLAEWGGGSELRPFCQVVIYYLKKKLARA